MRTTTGKSLMVEKLLGGGLAVILPILLVGITAVTLAKPENSTKREYVATNLSQVNAFPHLIFDTPVDIAHAGDSRLFIVEQAGTIRVASLTSSAEASIFLDISSLFIDGSERGLLGLAFHPDYKNNGFFYVNYTRRVNDILYTFVSQFEVTANANIADPNSELIILQVRQPFNNHNGGDLAFGPDGYLYIGLGDGGDTGDPLNTGQDPTSLLGSMLRLDVDGGGFAPDCGQSPANYTIPQDNPFVFDNDDKCNEIWAYGLRNPWRYSFDRQFHDLYIGDVGQFTWEEINFQPANTGGQNYGWRCYEGNAPYNLNSCNTDTSVYTFPIHVYESNNGPCSVTGGYVYRGTWYPELNGHYFYGDFCSGEIWSLHTDPPGAFPQMLYLDTNSWISTFGEDAYGELYFADRSGGRIYRLQTDNQVNHLSAKANAPISIAVGDPLTYTIKVQNSGNVTLTNVTVTNSLPTYASYVSGGTLMGNVVSWPTFDLAPYGDEMVQFVVTTTTAVVNDDYRVSADGEYEAFGAPVYTFVEPVTTVYLPAVSKPR